MKMPSHTDTAGLQARPSYTQLSFKKNLSSPHGCDEKLENYDVSVP